MSPDQKDQLTRLAVIVSIFLVPLLLAVGIILTTR